ncbi:hypothetical protein ECEPECA14_4899 [Escherichia coli EPECa14]|nr:hypothetical protein ECEPECA14_4899 [Escherichia coli EPECa14]EHW64676.1 hypothetical protein ECDEC10A_1856 [Escherichia coli DEC10A]EHW81336.1 hypothetical protein ECDEC10D_1735 [Escherichia coli DEC10D]EHW94000.1 hypothetical protein ECDEC10E_1428 [Escherichia coli DEC10E]
MQLLRYLHLIRSFLSSGAATSKLRASYVHTQDKKRDD